MTVYFALGIAIIIGIVIFARIGHIENHPQYRIKKVVSSHYNGFESDYNKVLYYPQYKGPFSWNSYLLRYSTGESYGYENVAFKSKDEALSFIKKREKDRKTMGYIDESEDSIKYIHV